MASRIDACFASLRRSSRKGLITYLTAGYPDVDSCAVLIHELGQWADAVELGLPCANSSADGPVIRDSHLRALAKGANFDVILKLVQNIRAAKFGKPIVLMAHLEQVKQPGAARFFEEVRDAGVDAVLIPDLRDLARLGLSKDAGRTYPLIACVSPNTADNVLIDLVSRCFGFVYMASQSGPSGSTLPPGDEMLAAGVARIRAVTDLPVGVGIGIKTPDDARRVARLADAVIVGTAIAQLVQDTIGNESHSIDGSAARLRPLLRSLAEAMNPEEHDPGFQVIPSASRTVATK